jgi:D-glycero-D-manno-heptose 1,7-bisphosphate phosphatase
MPELLEAAVAQIDALHPDLLAVTGDLVDHPLYALHDPTLIALGERDLQLVRELFGRLTCPVAYLYGNHDHPASFRAMFGEAPRDFDVDGYRILLFLDEEVENHHPQRMGEERTRFLSLLADGDPRPQVHLQHYLIAPRRNRTYPHTYREHKSLQDAVVADGRVQLVLSGHYHRGARVLRIGNTTFSTAPAFCEPPHRFRFYDLTAGGVIAHERRLRHQTPTRRAVFLDRDGVINPQPSYRTGPEPFSLIDGVGEALARLKRAGYALVVVSNQTAVGHGYVTRETVGAVNDKMAALLGRFGVELDGVYCRYHGPTAVLPGYRTSEPETKPSPVMLLEAANDLQLDLGGSFMVGDRKSDVQAGRDAGCRASLLVRTGAGCDEQVRLRPGEAVAVVADLPAAVDWILSRTDRAAAT